MFWAATVAKSLGHLLKVSVTGKQTQAFLFSLSLICKWVAQCLWLALQQIFWAFSLCVSLSLWSVFFCESSVFLSWNLVLFRNNRVATVVTTGHKKCQTWNIMLLKFTIWYNCSPSSFAFKMVSEGGRGSLLDAFYWSKEIPYYPALLICGQTHWLFCVCVSSTLGQITFAHNFPLRTDFPTAASVLLCNVSFTWISWMIWLKMTQLNAWLCLTFFVKWIA